MTQNASTKPVLKILVLGDSGVGKSSALDIYHRNGSFQSLEPSIKVHTYDIVDKLVNGDRYMIELLDAPGGEDYRSSYSPSYPGCHAFVLFFAHDDPASFENLTSWHQDILNYVHPQVPFIVVGNKCDWNRGLSKIYLGHILYWCAKRGMTYYEISCHDDIRHINLIFEDAYVKAKIFWVEHGERATEETEQKYKLCCSSS